LLLPAQPRSLHVFGTAGLGPGRAEGPRATPPDPEEASRA